jgi:hypothetical protein
VPDTIFCPNCGERISARARFCPSCGASQEEFHVDPPAPDAPPREHSPPGAPGLATAAIVAAARAAGVSAAIVLAAGLLIAAITPDASIIGWFGLDAGIVAETFRQAVGTLLTAMADDADLLLSGARRTHPLILLAIPLGALIFSTRRQLYRTEGAPPLARFGWAALVGLPFGVLMLFFAIIGGSSDTGITAAPASAFALGVLWGVIGGLIGAATKLGLADVVDRIPRVPRTALAAALAALRPLAVVVLTCTVVGTIGWVIQTARNVGDVRSIRSVPTGASRPTATARSASRSRSPTPSRSRAAAAASGSSPTTTPSPAMCCSPRSCC